MPADPEYDAAEYADRLRDLAADLAPFGCRPTMHPTKVIDYARVAILGLTRERDEARAALAAARVDGARGMREDAAAILDAEARRMQDAADALLDGDGDVTDIEKNHRLNARASSLRVAAEKVRALDPATVGSAPPPRERHPCTACPNFVPTNGAGNGWACRAIDDSADWIDRTTGATNGRMADGHEVPIPQDARTCPAFGKPATVGSGS